MTTYESGKTVNLTLLEGISKGDCKTCAICGKAKENPKFLECLHSFCLECLETGRFSHGTQCLCPLCKTPSQIPKGGVENLEDDVYSVGSMRSAKPEKPSPCDACGKEDATSSCAECGDKYCGTCSSIHVNMKASKGHTIEHTEQNINPVWTKRILCSIHHTEMKFCCVDCNEAVCADCNMTTHKQHSSQDIEPAAQEKRETLKHIVSSDGRNTLNELTTQHTNLINSKSTFLTKVQTCKERITQRVAALKEELDKTEENLMNILDTSEVVTTAAVDSQIDVARLDVVSALQSLDFANKLVNHEDDAEVISKFSKIQTTVDRMKSEHGIWIDESLDVSLKQPTSYKEDVERLCGIVTTSTSVDNLRIEDVRRAYLDIYPFEITGSCTGIQEGKILIAFGDKIQQIAEDGPVGKAICCAERVCDIASNSYGHVYVACKRSVKTITSDNQIKTCFSLEHTPSGIFVSDQGIILVAFEEAGDIRSFQLDGKLLSSKKDQSWIKKMKPSRLCININKELCFTQEKCLVLVDTNNAVRVVELDFIPSDICCTRQGHIVLLERGVIHLFTQSGQLLKKLSIESGQNDGSLSPLATVQTNVNSILGGPSRRMLSRVTIDRRGNIWITLGHILKVFRLSSKC